MSDLPGIAALGVGGKRVLVRADLNVPLADGAVADDYRIRASLPTIELLREQGASVVVCSHLGRPEGVDPALRMDPVADALGALGGFPVVKIEGVAGPDVEAALAGVTAETVAVLENTRFEPGEKLNDPDLAKGLARLADVFVLDAFGTAHRSHASTVGVAERLPSAAGLLLEAEVDAFTTLAGSDERPYVVALGGAKISEKLRLIENLLEDVDIMLLGGGMCFTLLAVAGYEVGTSLIDADLMDEVADLLESPHGGKILLPDDVVVTDRFAADAAARITATSAIPVGTMGLDIGPNAVARFSGVIANARRLFWNGPMGVFEWPAFRSGTAGVAAAVAACEGFTVVGGGDSVAALRALGEEGKVSHVSTGGGAGLALLEGAVLPGIEALRRWRRA